MHHFKLFGLGGAIKAGKNKNDRMKDLINDNALCKTAPASQGLIKWKGLMTCDYKVTEMLKSTKI